MNKVLGPYYDTEKSIDYFYDFRVVRYHYGVKSADGSVPETEVTWKKLGRDSKQELDAFSLTKDKKTNNYFLNPFPFYIDNMTPPSILGLITINKESSSETIDCWL
jgi:hypothetical protein